jgi:hypothetical protein
MLGTSAFSTRMEFSVTTHKRANGRVAERVELAHPIQCNLFTPVT